MSCVNFVNKGLNLSYNCNLRFEKNISRMGLIITSKTGKKIERW